MRETLDELDGGSDSRLVAHSRKVFDSELSSLQDSLCNFISGGVLEGARNHARRRDALAQLGFTGLPATRGPLTSHDVVLVAGLVFLAMLFVPLMMRRFIDPLPLPQNLRILVTVPIVYAIAIVAAIYPKAVWPFAARQPGGERPFAAYAVSGVIAAAASFVVSLVFRFVFDKSGNIFQSLSTPGAFQEALGDDARSLALAADDLLHHGRGRLDRRRPGAGRSRPGGCACAPWKRRRWRSFSAWCSGACCSCSRAPRRRWRRG